MRGLLLQPRCQRRLSFHSGYRLQSVTGQHIGNTPYERAPIADCRAWFQARMQHVVNGDG